MRALTVAPGVANSAKVEDIPEPPQSDGAVLVRALALGVCGTDREIVSGAYGWAPPGQKRLVIGHESLGKVQEAPADSGFKAGDLVVGIVRRPDPVPCPYCAVGEWDMCQNGRYTERGIKERNGYGSDLFRIEPDFLIKLDPSLGMNGVLVEPTSVVAKAWDQTERIGARSRGFAPKRLLVTDALGLIPGFGDDAGRLDQDAVDAERRIELDQKVRLDAEKIRAVAIALLDAALGVAAVLAHVPFADGAIGTRHRIGPAHDADDEIAGLEAASRRALPAPCPGIRGR